MANFIHKFFKPHCDQCVTEREEAAVCQSCETLKSELATLRFERKQLMDHLLGLNKPEIPQELPKQEVKSTNIPWRIRREAMERDDREKARIIREMREQQVEDKKSTEELEKELGISDEVKDAS